ncbi:MAG: M20/M25/M40 family metallo-hydrolase [Gemmatimonadaceae bacterium]
MPTRFRTLHALVIVACAAATTSVLPAQSASSRATSDSLSAVERAIATHVDRRTPQAIALLEQVVNINSGTMNFAGVRQVGDVFRARFDALGFKTTWVDGTAFGRAGHLMAEHKAAGPKILLIGHLDTVFEPTSPFQKFEMLADSMARGPGITDMKGGDVIILLALEALKAAGALDKLNLVVVLDGDEEHAGEPVAKAREAVVDAARGAAVAIGFEDGAGDVRTGIVARRGASSWTLTVKGTPAHSGQIFRDSVGPGAVFETARILDAWRSQLSTQAYLTFNPGVALGGTRVALDGPQNKGTAEGKNNIVAEHMVVQGDLRALSPGQLDSARQVMREVVARSLPHTSATVEFEDGYPPLAPTDGNRRLLAMYAEASRQLGLGDVVAVDPSKAGAADVSFVASLVPMIIDGIGLAGRDGHTSAETADLRTLSVRAKRAAVLLHRLTTRSVM